MIRDPLVRIKQGDTLRLQCAMLVARTRAPQPLLDWQVAASVRTESGRLVDQLEVEDFNQALGRYWLTKSPARTRAWPPELLQADIRYADPTGRVMHTETFFIRVFRSVTLPP